MAYDPSAAAQPASPEQQQPPASTAHFAPSGADLAADSPQAVYQPHEQVEPSGVYPCPYCTVGVMHVVAYDENATHEDGNLVFAPKFKSGGSALLQCRHCGKGHSVALNPTEAPSDPLAGRV